MTIQMEQAVEGTVLLDAPHDAAAFEFPVARRGYDTGAVQAYVAASSVELRHLADVNRSLMQRVGDLETRLAAAEAAAEAASAAATRMAAAAPPPPAAVESASDSASVSRQPLFSINRAAASPVATVSDETVTSARAEADRIVAEARARAEQLLRDADAQVSSKRAALVGGLAVLQDAIARTLGDLSGPR